VNIKKYAVLAKSILAANLKRPGHPYKLTFALTSKCNYRCQTCNIWQKPPQDELSAAEIERFFKKAPGFSWIDLTGGEVFLRRDFLEIVEIILAACPNLLLLHFPTNGYLTETIVPAVERIAGRRPEKLILTISMDGDEAVNDRIRGIPGGWRRQIETFKRLRGIPGVQTVLGMTVSALNAGQFAQAFAAAKKEYPPLQYDDFHVNIAHVSPHYYGNASTDLVSGSEKAMAATVQNYMRARKFPLGPVSFLEKRYLRRVDRYLETKKTPVRCQALRSSCFLDPVGGVYPCTMYDRLLGNIREWDYGLPELWNSQAARRLQGEIWEFNCPQCWTPCEAYQSILGSLWRRDHGRK
jgi:radical SAM protein with 4Fe4S-binding SPASM domain